jgi:hypothetical protein
VISEISFADAGCAFRLYFARVRGQPLTVRNKNMSLAFAAAAALFGVPSGKNCRFPWNWTRAYHSFVRCRLPESDIGLRKVAKIFHFLATFLVHPWTVLTFHELVLKTIELLEKLVQEPLYRSKRLISDHRNWYKQETLNHWVVGSIPTRCMPQCKRLTFNRLRLHREELGHFSATFEGFS